MLQENLISFRLHNKKKKNKTSKQKAEKEATNITLETILEIDQNFPLEVLKS